MEYPKQITVIQAAAILISTIIGVGVLPLPLFAVNAANSGAPLVTLLGILFGFIGLWLITKLGMRFPDQSIIQYSEHLVGKFISRIGSLTITIFFALLTSLAAREFGEVVVTAVLKNTPLEITVMVMLALAAITTRIGITTFAYIHHFYLPLIVFPGLIIVILSLKNAETIYLLPILGNEPSFSFLLGILTVAALFQGTFIMTMVIPGMRRPEKAMKASFWGMTIAGSFYLLIVVANVAVFGSEEIKLLIWPTLELARTTSIPGAVLERLDALFLAVWVTAVFTTLLSSYYLTIHSISQQFRLRDHKMLSSSLLPFIFVIAMIPENIIQIYDVIETIGRIGLCITIFYPFILLMIAVIRKKGEVQSAHPKQKNT